MSTRFPGMDPYLEQQGAWREVRAELIVGIQQFLTPLLEPRYRVTIEEDIYVTELPADEEWADEDLGTSAEEDVPQVTYPADSGIPQPIRVILPMGKTSKQRYLAVREAKTGQKVTVIEILSHLNKSNPMARERFRRKRHEVLNRFSNWVEIGLLREGQPLVIEVAEPPSTVLWHNYHIIFCREEQYPQAYMYLFGIRHPIPDIPIPLRPDEPEPILPLNQILHEIYERGRYNLLIDYQEAPLLDEPCAEEGSDAEWEVAFLSQRGYV